MTKSIFLSMCLLVLLSACLFGQHTKTKMEAYKIVRQKVIIDTLNNNVEVSKIIIPPNTVIPCMLDSITSPAWDSWFFFIDYYPYDNWGHACKYIFLNTVDGTLKIIDGKENVYLPLDTLIRMKPRIGHIPISMRKK